MQLNMCGVDIWKGSFDVVVEVGCELFILIRMIYFALVLGFPSACHILTLDIWMANSSHVFFFNFFIKCHFL